MKNVFLILISLAFVSVAHAGPYGLKGGMTVDEIIGAGFEFNKEKAESMVGDKISDQKASQNVKILKKKEIDYDLRSIMEVSDLTNAKYPNMVFRMQISKFVGLVYLQVNIYGEDKKNLSTEAVKKLCDIYKDKFQKKYKSIFQFYDAFGNSLRGWEGHFSPSVNKISSIFVTANDWEIQKKDRVDTRNRDVNVGITYMFTLWELHNEVRKIREEEKLQEELKNLTPNEDDL